MLLVVGTAHGQNQTLDIIEHSSTLLTAKFNGADIPASDIVNFDSDAWDFQLPEPDINRFSTWAEPPGSTTTANRVLVNSGTVIVVSENSLPSNNANGATDTTDFFIGGAHLNVTFTDNGDVPDAAATLSLLSLSLAGLGILRKRLSS